MESAANIETRIRTELASYLKRDAATVLPDFSLRDDLGLDSMAIIELLYRIEDAFNLQIPDEDLQALITVGDVVAYVEKKYEPPRSVLAAKRPGAKRAPNRKK